MNKYMKLNMKKILVSVFALNMIVLITACNQPQGTVVAKVENLSITKEEVNERINAYPPQLQQELQKKENKVRVLDQMVDELVLYKAAQDEGLHKTDEFDQQLENAKRQILINMLIRKKVDENLQVSNEEMEQLYQQNVARFPDVEFRKVRHIQVATEAEAREIRSQLMANRSRTTFARLAQEKSQDKDTSAQGGELPWFTQGQFVKSFEDAAFALKNKSDISPVIQTDLGYHIIMLDDVKQDKLPMNDPRVQAQLRQALGSQKKQQLTNEYLETLKKDMTIQKYADKLE